MSKRQVLNALISVFDKEGLDVLLDKMVDRKIHIFSTGGTQKFIEQKGVAVSAVEDLTSYPSILGGRVKTLHPKVFGGILARREHPQDQEEVSSYDIPFFDLVIVDLYPFEETLKAGGEHEDIIEKIDIGGISLIRAAAKNYADVLVVPSKEHYPELLRILERGDYSTIEERKKLSGHSFGISASYDRLIQSYLCGNEIKPLRYGENPHQKGAFYGNLSEVFDQLHGKELSYNNLLDVDATVNYLKEFQEPTVAIVKHNNTCGIAIDDDQTSAWKNALASDPLSAFGGIVGLNTKVEKKTAEEINDLFIEVILAPDYDDEALELLKSKKNRVILKTKDFSISAKDFRSLLNGHLVQDKDLVTAQAKDIKITSQRKPTENEKMDLLFAEKIAKNSKSNTIVLAKNQRLLGLGCGMTSRIDALKHAIAKAKEFNLDLKGAVMASDAFFPFADCVELAHKEGIVAAIHPGGSIRDKDSIAYCDQNNMAMITTGKRHFKH